MSAIGFNCRGMGGAATLREIRDLAKLHAPTVLFIFETQLHKKCVESLARSIGFERGFAVSSTGRSGGWVFSGIIIYQSRFYLIHSITLMP